MNDRPLLLLDVDGVISGYGGQAIMRDREDPSPWEAKFEWDDLRFPNGEAQTVTVRLFKGVRERVQQLAEHFEIVWCTAWTHRAHECYREHLGLPDEPWDHIKFEGWDGYIFRSHSWKLSWVDDYIDDRPAVWIDDDLHNHEYEWARRRTDAGIPTAIIQPAPHLGLQDHHVAAAVAWAQYQVTA